MYKAKHYVRVNGKTFTRGESIPEGLSPDKVAWLLKAGAIEEVVPGYTAAPQQDEAPAPEPVTDESDKPEVMPEEEADDDAEAPEIDVMAGIVAGEQEEPKKTTRKAATRKTTERRKTK